MTGDTDTTDDDPDATETDDEHADVTAEATPGGDHDEATPDGDHDEAAPASDDPEGAASDDGEADVRAYLLKGALVLLVVLGVVATLQFYLSAQTAIRRMASEEFRPAFVAAFNLVVLLAVGVGIAQVVRRLG